MQEKSEYQLGLNPQPLAPSCASLRSIQGTETSQEPCMRSVLPRIFALLVLMLSTASWAQVAVYSFDDSTRDLSDNGNTALRYYDFFSCGESENFIRCPQWSTDRHGARRYALEFNLDPEYQQQHVRLPDLGLSGDFTVAAWVRFLDPGQSYERIIDFGFGTQQDNIVLARVGTSNDLIFIIYEGSQPIGNCVASNVITGRAWAHFAGTWRSGDQRIYKNGVEVAACTAVGEPQNVPRPNSFVGRSNWASDAYFRGSIDHLWVDDRALSAAEVQALAEEGMLRSQGVAAYYAFDGNRFDGSGNGRTGQGVGTQAFAADWLGRTNPYASFDMNSPALGDTHYIVIPDLELAGSVSVSAWARMTEIRTWGRIVDLADQNGRNNIILGRLASEPNDLVFEVYNGNASLGKCIAQDVIPYNPGNPATSSWAHYTATWADGRQRIYAFGTLVQSCAFPGEPLAVAREKSYIGHSNFAGDENFKGRIDELWIVDRELSADEASSLALDPNALCLDDIDDAADDFCFTGDVIGVGSPSTRRQLCDPDWVNLSRNVPALGARVRIRTSNLAQGADTVIELHRNCQFVGSDDNSGPGSASQVVVEGDTVGFFDLRIVQAQENYAAGGAYTLTAEPVFDSIFDDAMEEINPDLLQFKGVDYNYPAKSGSAFSPIGFEWLTGSSISGGVRNFAVYNGNSELGIRFKRNEKNTIDGGVVDAGVLQVLQPGMTVGPNSSFSHEGNESLWRAGASGYIGFRTLNPESEQTNYGYARFSTSGPSGYPATLHSWTVDTSGAPIVIQRDY